MKGLTYDGYDLSSLLMVENVIRPLVPPMEVTTAEVGSDGAPVKRARLLPMTVRVLAHLVSDEKTEKDQIRQLEDMRRKVAYRLYRKEPCRLVLPDAPDVFLMAVLADESELERLGYTRGTEISFRCADPVAYGSERFKEAKSGGIIRCNVGGTYTTMPTVAVLAESAEVTVKFDGVEFSTLGNFSSADPLIIDALAHVASKGQIVVPVSIMSDWPEWEPGVHTIECSHPFAVSWRERWL
ncbi:MULTISPECIES: distal tail protein Dit [Gordonibacter]|uniref:Phage tail family protein n=1 Tax=Gordonibacter faecis TaxID=3047475 RepID=A0ABT7DQ16_9ACTN|nr:MULTISPECIES: distal tail protein Dit [unclassified Gordonibacter]MDJ1651623.1 phage tail family protein [Gordonibacter sp. KGMB12511]HIW77045.1 phage tail family protein [Candidatus Gordonibacter avicola]